MFKYAQTTLCKATLVYSNKTIPTKVNVYMKKAFTFTRNKRNVLQQQRHRFLLMKRDVYKISLPSANAAKIRALSMHVS